MNRKETLNLLSILMANYPNAVGKIKDASKTADAWEMAFGTVETEKVYKAARLHMETSKFFPTPADILEKITRADLLYSVKPVEAIEAPAIQKEKESYYLEELCKFVGLGCEPDINADLTQDNFLPYEK